MRTFTDWWKERVPNWPGIGAVLGFVAGLAAGYSNRPSYLLGLRASLSDLRQGGDPLCDAAMAALPWVIILTVLGVITGLVVEKYLTTPTPPPAPGS